MPKNIFAVVFLAICPLIIAQEPIPAPPAPAEQQTPQAPAAQTAPTPLPDTLLDGTPVRLRLTQSVSSEEAKTGEEVPFEVLEEVDINGVAVIKKGDTAFATIIKAEPKKMMGRAGKLDMSISYVRLSDQEKITLRAEKTAKGKNDAVGITVGIVATGVLFFPAAPLFLLRHGKEISIPQGSLITAYVVGDTHINLDKFRPAPPPSAAPVAVAVVQIAISIDSTPPGADIEVDGAFVGNTPSTVTVAPGFHQIAVKKKGFTDWTKTLNVTSGAVHLNAQLEQTPAQPSVQVPPPPPSN